MKSLASPMNRRGSTLAEFVVVCLMLMLVVFAAIEFDPHGSGLHHNG